MHTEDCQTGQAMFCPSKTDNIFVIKTSLLLYKRKAILSIKNQKEREKNDYEN